MHHFVTSSDGGFVSHKKFLSDEAYADALDSIVKGCSDVLIMDSSRTKVLLGKRLVHPQPDFWFMGGRMLPGETPSLSISRILKRELGLAITPERLSFVSASSLAWDRREQEPKENGTCDIQVVFSLELSQEEAMAVVLDPKEYASSKWESIDAVLHPDSASLYHPALRYSVREFKAREIEKRMKEAAAMPISPQSNELLLNLARSFCSLRVAPEEGIAPYRVVSQELGYNGVVNVIL